MEITFAVGWRFYSCQTATPESFFRTEAQVKRERSVACWGNQSVLPYQKIFGQKKNTYKKANL